MSFGGKKSAASTTPALSAISIQTMGFGTPIQICYGVNRVSPTLGWTSDFVATAHQDNSQSGGKGGGGGGGGNVTYTYTSAIILLVCEGPIWGYRRAWHDKNITYSLEGFSYANGGAQGQAVWGYLTTNHPDQALSYSGTALVAASSYALSDSATLGNHSFEVLGLCRSNTPTDQNYWDAQIKDVIADFISNPRYGVISSQTANLTLELDNLHAYCRARSLLISPLLNAQKPAHEYLTEWALVANSGIVWSEGKLKFIPYADQAFSNAYGSYTPDTTIRYHFDDDNVKEPIAPKRKKPIDCFNKVTVECLNRWFDYNKYPVSSKDQAAIEQFGLRPADTLVLDSVCLPGIAIIVAHTQLLRGLYIRNEYTIKGWCNVDLLEPLDFITLTDAELGLDTMRCRVVSIEDDQYGYLTITAEEAPLGVYCG